ncbi:MAG: hypothetical protein V8T36_06930 [Ruthenibacterium lactatiformans]
MPGVGGYLYASTRNDFLWLDLEQLPHREATILYAQDRETGEWVEYARLEATQQKIWVPLSEIPRTCSTHLWPLRTSIFTSITAFPSRARRTRCSTR